MARTTTTADFHSWHQGSRGDYRAAGEAWSYYLAGTAAGMDDSAAVQLYPNTLYAVPFISGKPGWCDRIAINITAKATAVPPGPRAQLGVYGVNCLSHPKPDGCILSGSDICVASANMQTLSIVRSLLPDGLYWLAILSQASIAVTGINPAQVWGVFGYHASSAGFPLGMAVASWAYGLLPDAFPTSATAVCSVTPAIGLHYVRGYL